MATSETRGARPIEAVDTRAAVGDPPRILYEGLVAGTIGYAVLALLLALWSWSRGHSPLYPAALLGANLFTGSVPASDAAIELPYVLAYNGAHLLVFLAFGFAMAWLVGVAERIPQGWYLTGIGFLFVVAHIAAYPAWFDAQVRAALPGGLIALATTLSFLAMGGWLVAEHPALRAGAHEPD